MLLKFCPHFTKKILSFFYLNSTRTSSRSLAWRPCWRKVYFKSKRHLFGFVKMISAQHKKNPSLRTVTKPTPWTCVDILLHILCLCNNRTHTYAYTDIYIDSSRPCIRREFHSCKIRIKYIHFYFIICGCSKFPSRIFFSFLSLQSFYNSRRVKNTHTHTIAFTARSIHSFTHTPAVQTWIMCSRYTYSIIMQRTCFLRKMIYSRTDKVLCVVYVCKFYAHKYTVLFTYLMIV